MPVVLFGLVFLSYGLWIPWMGLFGNDLSYLWYHHLLGAWGPGEFASIDRPVSALFYAVSMSLLGEAVWPYHVLLLLLRWLSAVLLWWVLGQVWPERRHLAGIAALLLAVYPGFRQNPVALEFILHFFVLDLFLLSVGTMLLAVCQLDLRSRRYWGLTLVTVLGSAGVFSLEYFIGLEILRPIFLWIVARRTGFTGKTQWKRILAAWAPALGVVLAFLFWRVFIFSFPTYRPVLLETLRAKPLAGLLGLGKNMARDSWTALAGAWLQTLKLPTGLTARLVYGVLALAAVILVVWLLRWLAKNRTSGLAARSYAGEAALGIGLLAMIAGGSIFWLTGIPITLDFPWDRSTLALMPGVCIALAGLIEMAVTPRYHPLLVAMLVGLAVGMHSVNAQEYRAEWQKLRDFYWQLAWRAPQLEPRTLALFDVIPLNRYSDNDMTALLNWTYAPEQHSRQVAYKFFDLTLRFDGAHAGLPGLQKGLPVEHDARGTYFKTTTSSTLALLYNPPACLKILAPEDALLPGLPQRIAKVLPITRLEQVNVSGEQAQPPAQLGPEPAHGWCYYFQKAGLALQQQDWTAVTALGDQASQAGLHPANPAELLPFIEGYARAGNMERAGQLSAKAAQQADLRPALCRLWKRVPGGTAAIPKELGCQAGSS